MPDSHKLTSRVNSRLTSRHFKAPSKFQSDSTPKMDQESQSMLSPFPSTSM
jgi:hypothetical protein